METGGPELATHNEDRWTQCKASSSDVRGDDLDPAHGCAVARPAGVVRAVAIGVHAILSLVTIGGPRRLVQGACTRTRWRRISDRRDHRARPPRCVGRSKKNGAQEIGRSRGGPSTKIHAVVDALGNPVKLALSPGQTHEMKLAYALLADISNAYVAGDRAYDAAPLAQMLEAHGCSVVIPSNPTRAKQRPYDRHLYRERCLVEHLFQRIKRFRRIAMRFEKLARNFLAFLHLVSILVWLR